MSASFNRKGLFLAILSLCGLSVIGCRPTVSMPGGGNPVAGPPSSGVAVFQSLQPELIDGEGRSIRRSTQPLPAPQPNALFRLAHPEPYAYRDIRVQFLPVEKFRGTAVRWQFAAGRMRGKQVAPFQTVPGSGSHEVLDGNAIGAVRVFLPAVGLNGGRVRVVSGLDSSVSNELELMVPPLVVIDPGHGGKHNLAGSSWNNAKTSGGVLEKDLTLDYSRSLRDELFNLADQKGIPLQVLLTRDADVNVSGQNRAAVARQSGADRMVVIHFNGFNGVARGTLQVRRSAAKGNINVSEDDRVSNRMVDAVVSAFQRFDPAAYRRNHVDLGATVTSDRYLGNTRQHHPVRCAYLELEFMDNPAVEYLLTGPRRREVQSTVSQAMAGAIYADLLNP